MESKSTSDKRLKYLSLIFLTVQNSAQILSMRYARTRVGPMFLSSTLILNAEILKLITCLLVLYRQHRGISKWSRDLKSNIFDRPLDTLNVGVPALIFVIQNNLLYLASTHLDVATYQVTYQLKTLTTAMFSILILRRRLQKFQWTALLFLTAGVVTVELADTPEQVSVTTEIGDQNRSLGITAALLASTLSGFAGIYFEKILKGSEISIWIRNVQLALCSVPFAAITCLANSERKYIMDKGYFYGYDMFVVYLVFLQAFGGLLVAMVVKAADNILKGFATSFSMILTFMISILYFSFEFSVQFCFGAILVIISIFLYGYQPAPTSKMVKQPFISNV